MLKLKLQYFGHLMWRADSLENTLILGKKKKTGEVDDRGQDGWMVSQTQWTWVWASSWRWWRTGNLACCSPWGCKESDTTEQLNNNCMVPPSWTPLFFSILTTWQCELPWGRRTWGPHPLSASHTPSQSFGPCLLLPWTVENLRWQPAGDSHSCCLSSCTTQRDWAQCRS